MRKEFVLTTIIYLWGCFGFCCTGFMATSGERVLIGNNEDNSLELTDTVVRIRPASDGKYGCLLVGFNRQNFSMGGMNDQGLFYDWFSVPETNWMNSPDKLPYSGWMPIEILEQCANVEEAIEFCRTYNLSIFKAAQVMLVDKKGHSAIVAWGEDDIEVIRREGNYQVISNFYINHPERGSYPCGRFSTAERMLQDGEVSIELFRLILDAVHQVLRIGQTQYSNIYELQLGDIYIFNEHNFDEFVKMNIFEELPKGEYTYPLPWSFSEMKLLSPGDDSVLNSTSVTFRWQGKTDSSYSVLYSTDPSFADANQVNYIPGNYQQAGGLLFAVFAGIFLLGITEGKRRRNFILAFATILIMSFLFFSCNRENSNELSSNEHSMTVENLQPDTVYYWKIMATSKGELTSESITCTFRTGN